MVEQSDAGVVTKADVNGDGCDLIVRAIGFVNNSYLWLCWAELNSIHRASWKMIAFSSLLLMWYARETQRILVDFGNDDFGNDDFGNDLMAREGRWIVLKRFRSRSRWTCRVATWLRFSLSLATNFSSFFVAEPSSTSQTFNERIVDHDLSVYKYFQWFHPWSNNSCAVSSNVNLSWACTSPLINCLWVNSSMVLLLTDRRTPEEETTSRRTWRGFDLWSLIQISTWTF